MKLASGSCPSSKLIASGVNVALGTDGAASNNDLDMFGEMRSAALLGKITSEDASALPAAAVLQMATLNGARALGLGEETGSLTPGKSADMVCVNLKVPACQPVHNPLSLIVYSAGRDQVSDVWVAGRALYSEGKYLTTEPEEVLARAGAWMTRMQAEA